MAEAGIVLFILVIAALFLATYLLSRRYSIGRSRRVEEVARETELRDGMSGLPTGGFPPYYGNPDPSPRERLRQPPEEQ
ncbi:MAG TPA: hypothetical protein VGK15_00520 [Candidatus Limnocylindria bacterium]|jgi:hypothetical protein